MTDSAQTTPALEVTVRFKGPARVVIEYEDGRRQVVATTIPTPERGYPNASAAMQKLMRSHPWPDGLAQQLIPVRTGGHDVNGATGTDVAWSVNYKNDEPAE